MQAVVATQRKITPEPKKEALKEPEMSYAKFVGGVEVLNLKAAGRNELRNTSPASVRKATPRTLDRIEKATTRFNEGNDRPVEEGSDAVGESECR